MYVQCIIKYILSYPDIAQNTLHGLLLQILFIAKAQSQSEDHTAERDHRRFHEPHSGHRSARESGVRALDLPRGGVTVRV